MNNSFINTKDNDTQSWVELSLGDILKSIDNRVKKIELKEQSKIPILSMTRHNGLVLQKDKFDKRVASKNISNYKVVKKGQLVQGFPMDEGVIYFLKKYDYGAVSPTYTVWELTSNDVAREFLDYYLRSPAMINIYNSLCSKTVHRRRIVNHQDFKQIKVKLPSIKEQRTIAHILSTFQQAIDATDKVISATQALKKSLMQHLFTYGPVSLEEAENVPLKETEVGMVPEHWDIACLRDLTSKCSQIDPRNTPNSKIKYIDVSGISNQTLRIEDYKEFYGKDSPSRARKKIHFNDVIIATVRPYLKRIALVPECLDGELCSTAFCVLRALIQKIYPIFLFYCVTKNDFILRASASQRGSSYPAITDKDVLNQPIPLPNLADQKKIVNILKSLDTKIQAEIKNKTALQTLFNSMLHHLMTGKVRVNDLNLELPEVVEQ